MRASKRRRPGRCHHRLSETGRESRARCVTRLVCARASGAGDLQVLEEASVDPGDREAKCESHHKTNGVNPGGCLRLVRQPGSGDFGWGAAGVAAGTRQSRDAIAHGARGVVSPDDPVREAPNDKRDSDGEDAIDRVPMLLRRVVFGGQASDATVRLPATLGFLQTMLMARSPARSFLEGIEWIGKRAACVVANPIGVLRPLLVAESMDVGQG